MNEAVNMESVWYNKKISYRFSFPTAVMLEYIRSVIRYHKNRKKTDFCKRGGVWFMKCTNRTAAENMGIFSPGYVKEQIDRLEEYDLVKIHRKVAGRYDVSYEISLTDKANSYYV